MKKVSFLRLLIVVLLGFALSFSSNIQDPPLMTYKVRELAAELPNTALGFLGFFGLLVAMVVQPVVGVFSDRARTPMGRRLPFIIGGAALIALSLFLLALAPSLTVLLLGVILIQFSSNVLQGPWQALLPDLVPEGQRGTASGLKALLDILAVVVGGIVAGQIFGRLDTLGPTVALLAAVVPTVVFILLVTITAIWAREQTPDVPAPERTVAQALREAFSVDISGEGGRPALRSLVWLFFGLLILVTAYNLFLVLVPGTPTLGALTATLPVVVVALLVLFAGSLVLDLGTQPSFRWWFVNRFLFWGAFIAINTFMINFLIDVVGMSQADAQSFRGTLTTVIGGALLVATLPLGYLSDRFGRKPIMIVAGLVAAAGAVLLLFVRERTLIILAGAVVGMGIGAFLSASWALATDLVPKADAARYLGIANIATCIGSGGARLLGGVLIDPLNAAFGASTGYLLMFGLAAAFFLFAALAVVPLPGKRAAQAA